MNSTFIVPIRIDSQKRLENINLIVNYLLKHTDSKIIVTERDIERKVFLVKDDRLQYRFQLMENGIFHRTKILNEMLSEVDTDITINYDADVVLEKNTYKKAEQMILQDGYDLVYPFGFDKINQHKILDTNPFYQKFKKSLDHIDLINSKSEMAVCRWGHVQFFKTNSYKNGYMENENFKEYAPEDVERGLRFQKLGYKVGFFESNLFHLEHPINPKLIPKLKKEGEVLFSVLEKMNKHQLSEYYNEQQYWKKYKRI